jgi:hypothetical protein
MAPLKLIDRGYGGSGSNTLQRGQYSGAGKREWQRPGAGQTTWPTRRTARTRRGPAKRWTRARAGIDLVPCGVRPRGWGSHGFVVRPEFSDHHVSA